jgi:hypothetical protein
MGAGLSRPLDRDPRCATLAPVWSPFVDAFVDTLHAGGEAVHPPPPRRAPLFARAAKKDDPEAPSSYRDASTSETGASSGADAGGDATTAASSATRPTETPQRTHSLRSPGKPAGPVFRPAVRRLVAIGDVHGDLRATTQALRAAGVLDDRNRWCGGTTTVVQVGDQLDRGGDEIAILFLLERLRFEARRAGGELIVMNGNHETLTAAGRFRYAAEASRGDLRRWRGRQLFGAALKHACGEKPGQCTLLGADAAAEAVERGRKGFPVTPPRRSRGDDDDRHHRETTKESAETTTTSKPSVAPGASRYEIHADSSESSWMPRLAAFAPGGPLATRFLAHQPVALAVGSTVFAHGGVLKTHVRRGLRRANRETSEWLAGSSGNALVPPLHVTGADSVVWARHYSHPDSWKCDCDSLEEALRALPGMRRVVVGHTIQGEKGINAACDGKALRVDVGMSRGCGGHAPEVLEIMDDGAGGISKLRWDAERKKVVREPVEGAT